MNSSPLSNRHKTGNISHFFSLTIFSKTPFLSSPFMTRKKVKLAFIANDSARKATYKKRKRGLLKKMDELTTLCDVKACAVLYSPYEARPVVWPGPSGAREVIASFKRLPEMEKVKKMVSQEEFLGQRVGKALDQLKRQQKENREKEMTQVMYQCLIGKSIQNMSLLDLSDLGWVINQQLSEINKKVEGFQKDNSTNNNNNDHNLKITNGSSSTTSSLPPQQPVGQTGHLDAMHMQMMMQPCPSFMDMMGGPPSMYAHHPYPYPHPHHMGIGGGGLGSSSGGENGSGSNNNGGGNNNMSDVMMMGQFGEYHGHGVNPSMWPNGYFP